MSILTTAPCPRCASALEPPESLEPSAPWERAIVPSTRCPVCGWSGQLYVFNPPQRQIDRPVDALPEDATCAHHPTKRAEHICAGTGDYICSLCAVQVNGQMFSAAYLNTHKAEVAGSLDRYIKRPDRSIVLFFLLSIFPYTALAGPVLWVLAWIRLFRTFKLRKADPSFADLVGTSRLIWLIVVLGLWTAIYGFAVIALLMAVVAEGL